MPRQTKGEHEAALAAARAEGAHQVIQLAESLQKIGLDLSVALGAMQGLSAKLSETALEMAAEAKRPAA